jgi:hypothetical protein
MSSRELRILLVLWIAADVFFIIFHVIYAFTPHLNHPFFNVEDDRSGGEAIQYAKEIWIAIAFLMIAYLRRSILYVPWALVFVYILFDDMLQLHEIWGRELAIALDYPEVIGLRPDDLGELTIYAIVIAILGPLVVAAYYWGHREFRRFNRHLVALLLVLTFFGVVLDMVHIMTTQPTLHRLVGLLEDGGELVVMSFIVVFALAALDLARNGSSSESPSLRFLRDAREPAVVEQQPEPELVGAGSGRSSALDQRRR